MTRRSRLWRVVAAAYVFINVAGAGYAVAMSEPMHAAVHVGLLLLGFAGYAALRLQSPARREDLLKQPDPRIEYLQQSVDAMALEVERIGEAQRFNDKLRAEKGETLPLKKEE